MSTTSIRRTTQRLPLGTIWPMSTAPIVDMSWCRMATTSIMWLATGFTTRAATTATTTEHWRAPDARLGWLLEPGQMRVVGI
jgi:hypothetical protein